MRPSSDSRPSAACRPADISSASRTPWSATGLRSTSRSCRTGRITKAGRSPAGSTRRSARRRCGSARSPNVRSPRSIPPSARNSMRTSSGAARKLARGIREGQRWVPLACRPKRPVRKCPWQAPGACMRTVSHVIGAAEPPLLEHTIGQALDLAVARWPDAEALVSVHQDVRLTWSELRQHADDFAAGLLALGLEVGNRVGIWAPNCAEWAIAQFATARAGLILVNINPAYRVSELQFTLNAVGVRVLICATRFKSSDYIAMVETLAPEIPGSAAGNLQLGGAPDLRSVIRIGGHARPGWHLFSEVHRLAGDYERARLASMAPGLNPRDPINIQFTSGTTGLPKGATLSHRNILNNGYFVGVSMGLHARDRLCIPVPLYHCFGMVMGNLACLVHGATMVYPSEGFDPLAVLRAVEAERCTALYGVPTMFIAKLELPDFDQFDLSSLRTGLM